MHKRFDCVSLGRNVLGECARRSSHHQVGLQKRRHSLQQFDFMLNPQPMSSTGCGIPIKGKKNRGTGLVILGATFGWPCARKTSFIRLIYHLVLYIELVIAGDTEGLHVDGDSTIFSTSCKQRMYTSRQDYSASTKTCICNTAASGMCKRCSEQRLVSCPEA